MGPLSLTSVETKARSTTLNVQTDRTFFCRRQSERLLCGRSPFRVSSQALCLVRKYEVHIPPGLRIIALKTTFLIKCNARYIYKTCTGLGRLWGGCLV